MTNGSKPKGTTTRSRLGFSIAGSSSRSSSSAYQKMNDDDYDDIINDKDDDSAGSSCSVGQRSTLGSDESSSLPFLSDILREDDTKSSAKTQHGINDQYDRNIKEKEDEEDSDVIKFIEERDDALAIDYQYEDFISPTIMSHISEDDNSNEAGYDTDEEFYPRFVR
eukprot:CAMPEP_0201600510 /NCGR_PEP_ID=MMETSP0492-20130828/1533_1 /ASSEMBLY_ACC=CAM_ASM_000837 /TAXON_ID=420259 /ORGANISM="Thalassiosira gravida, Strain GMp14c1" /LENGTH=165 /DNA_ID=CAMNT_0048063257 /DNA_START=108 /DNA_END=605 /DNA_ORIENTATION=-